MGRNRAGEVGLDINADPGEFLGSELRALRHLEDGLVPLSGLDLHGRVRVVAGAAFFPVEHDALALGQRDAHATCEERGCRKKKDDKDAASQKKTPKMARTASLSASWLRPNWGPIVIHVFGVSPKDTVGPSETSVAPPGAASTMNSPPAQIRGVNSQPAVAMPFSSRVSFLNAWNESSDSKTRLKLEERRPQLFPPMRIISTPQGLESSIGRFTSK